MFNSNNLARLIIAALTLLHYKSLLCQAGLCEENPDICELITGCYSDHDCDGSCVCNRAWWAFKPIGSLACPDEGCPLYVWIDGTGQDPYQEKPDQFYMMEMLKRGFVAVNVEYDNSMIDYGSGCAGKFYLLDFHGFTHKAQEIFDGTVADSVVSQMCDGPNAIANCNLGIAAHGWSQGAHIASLGGNYNPKVSANLLFGNGNSIEILGDMPCLNNENLALPRERRRSIVGSADGYFGRDLSGVLEQQKETSGYDCDNNTNCFRKLPDGCSYGAGEQYCEGYQTFFSSSCPTCDILPEEGPCPSNRELITSACPVQVPDTYLGGDELIEDTGGYYIITGQEYCNYTGCDPSEGVPHGFFQSLDAESDFLNPDIIWGLKQNFDWLARIARKTTSAQVQSPQETAPTTTPTKSPLTPTVSPTDITPSPSKSPFKSPPGPTAALTGQLTVDALSSSPTQQPTTNPTKSPNAKPWWLWWV